MRVTNEMRMAWKEADAAYLKKTFHLSEGTEENHKACQSEV
jgi:hypothetical protein